jgi:hypothetical protein
MTSSIPEYAGCPWPVDPACFNDDWQAMDASVKDRAVALASSTLHRLTGRRVTNCPVTVHPGATGAACFVPGDLWGATGPFHPGMSAQGVWVNNCGPTPSNPRVAVRLPRPVGRVDEVRVLGVVVPPADYQIMDGNLLVYTGAGAGWPVTGNIVDFSVTYLKGYPPDGIAAYATGLLAMEFAKACSGRSCRLPSGVVNIVRQGVAMEIDSGLFPKGTTGIREVDTFIALWNPRGQEPSTIMIPGVS